MTRELGRRGRGGTTAVMTQWQTFARNQVRLHGRGFAGPKLVCIDLQAYTTTQAPERSDVLNVGGFSDAVFRVVAAFLAGDASRFVTDVEALGFSPDFPGPLQVDRGILLIDAGTC